MARKDIQELYKSLLETELRFMPRGSQHIESIYDEVKQRFRDLCDDSYLCSECCKGGHNQPEWKHAVRRALDRLKNISPAVSKGISKHWVFQ